MEGEALWWPWLPAWAHFLCPPPEKGPRGNTQGLASPGLHPKSSAVLRQAAMAAGRPLTPFQEALVRLHPPWVSLPTHTPAGGSDSSWAWGPASP